MPKKGKQASRKVTSLSGTGYFLIKEKGHGERKTIFLILHICIQSINFF
jgi:hypothetical protein